MAPPRSFQSLQDLWYPVCVSSVVFIFLDILCVTLLIPKAWKEPFQNSTPRWSFYSCIFCQATLMVPLGFVVFGYEHGWDYYSLISSDAPSRTSTIFAFIIIGYMVKDLWYCKTDIELVFHHIGVILTNVWCLLEPGMPHAFFMFCTSILEIGSLVNNLVPFARTDKEKILVNTLNVAFFSAGHLLGLYWCYHLYFESSTSFWFRNLVVPEGLGIMFVRHYLVFKRHNALMKEMEKKPE